MRVATCFAERTTMRWFAGRLLRLLIARLGILELQSTPALRVNRDRGTGTTLKNVDLFTPGTVAIDLDVSSHAARAQQRVESATAHQMEVVYDAKVGANAGQARQAVDVRKRRVVSHDQSVTDRGQRGEAVQVCRRVITGDLKLTRHRRELGKPTEARENHVVVQAEVVSNGYLRSR